MLKILVLVVTKKLSMRKEFGRNNHQRGKIWAEKTITEEKLRQKYNSAEKLINKDF